MSFLGLTWGEPTTKRRMSDYFAAVHDGMPDVGQSRGWTAWQWRRAPIRRFRIADLCATNRGGYLSERHLQRYIKSGSMKSDGLRPCVVSAGGRLYLVEGHHRAIAEAERGGTHIDAHWKRI
jgi:hypothetical protein